jgi:hypothetical protein
MDPEDENDAAAKCDLHHVHWWSRGGDTNAANLIAACERHHYAVHDGEWHVTREPDGTTTWTAPTGHEYETPPASYPIDNTTKIKKDNDARLDDETRSGSGDDENPLCKPADPVSPCTGRNRHCLEAPAGA